MEEGVAVSELLAWAVIRKGNLRAIQRKNGIAYFFRYRLGGIARSKNFPVGTDQQYIKAFISDIEAKILKEKLGLEDFSQQAEPEKPKRLTIYELLEWYLRGALKESLGDRKEDARAYSVVTIENNEYAFKRFIRFLKSEDTPIDQIEKRHLYEYRRHLSEKGWVDRSIKQDIATVKAIFKKAFDEGLLKEYPFWGFKLKRISKSRPRDILTFREMQEIAKTIKDKYVRLSWYIGMYSGMRLADIMRIKKEDIDHEKRTIKFWMAKRREWIELPIRSEVAKILDHFKGQTGPLIRFAKGASKTAYVTRVPSVYFDAIRKLKGKGFHRSGPHTLRHSFSHILDLNGVRWDDKQFLLGHKIKDMTARYTHPEKRLQYFHEVLAKIKFDIDEKST